MSDTIGEVLLFLSGIFYGFVFSSYIARVIVWVIEKLEKWFGYAQELNDVMDVPKVLRVSKDGIISESGSSNYHYGTLMSFAFPQDESVIYSLSSNGKGDVYVTSSLTKENN